MKPILATISIAILIFVFLPTAARAQTSPPLPNPVLYFVGQEAFSANGASFVRYRYDVFNSSSFPDTLFAAAPALPPCGANNSASRSWVDLYDVRGKRLFGFCALGKSSGLNGIWFAMPQSEVPPSWIYIEINDRQTGAKYKSNLAETTL
ncbi:MAG TPA: hypothetical protein VMZ26_04780 [Pyrinomonadaceae bacterium]|nr:hypothetical protein [Pyrinomonadaceae bacterium]